MVTTRKVVARTALQDSAVQNLSLLAASSKYYYRLIDYRLAIAIDAGTIFGAGGATNDFRMGGMLAVRNLANPVEFGLGPTFESMDSAESNGVVDIWTPIAQKMQRFVNGVDHAAMVAVNSVCSTIYQGSRTLDVPRLIASMWSGGNAPNILWVTGWIDYEIVPADFRTLARVYQQWGLRGNESDDVVE